MKQFFSYVKGRVRADKILTAIVFVFIAFCVGSGIYFGVIGQARNCVMSFAYLLVVPVIYAVEYGVRLRFAPLFMAILLFLIAGGILGSAYDLYNYIPVSTRSARHFRRDFCRARVFADKALLSKEESNKIFHLSFRGAVVQPVHRPLMGDVRIRRLCVFRHRYAGRYADRRFSSYFLMGTHNATEVIDGITQTVIYYADGMKVILGGYLTSGFSIRSTICSCALWGRRLYCGTSYRP
ncbi:MAG: hypothetical protein ACLRTQ_00760 [Candidatus Borkfalkia sp.]